jgi:hypothetical protein
MTPRLGVRTRRTAVVAALATCGPYVACVYLAFARRAAVADHESVDVGLRRFAGSRSRAGGEDPSPHSEVGGGRADFAITQTRRSCCRGRGVLLARWYLRNRSGGAPGLQGVSESLGRENSALLAAAIINPRLLNLCRPSKRLLRRQRLILGRIGDVEPPPATPARR